MVDFFMFREAIKKGQTWIGLKILIFGVKIGVFRHFEHYKALKTFQYWSFDPNLTKKHPKFNPLKKTFRINRHIRSPEYGIRHYSS